MSDAEDINGNVRVESFLPSTSPKPESLKRKREEPVEQPSKQSKKRRKSKKPKDIDDGDLDEKLGVNRAIAQMDSRLLADLVAQRTKRFEPKLSLVELDEKYIPGTTDCA